MNKNYGEPSAAHTRACMRTGIATAAVMAFGTAVAFADHLAHRKAEANNTSNVRLKCFQWL